MPVVVLCFFAFNYGPCEYVQMYKMYICTNAINGSMSATTYQASYKVGKGPRQCLFFLEIYPKDPDSYSQLFLFVLKRTSANIYLSCFIFACFGIFANTISLHHSLHIRFKIFAQICIPIFDIYSLIFSSNRISRRTLGEPCMQLRMRIHANSYPAFRKNALLVLSRARGFTILYNYSVHSTYPLQMKAASKFLRLRIRPLLRIQAKLLKLVNI